jgi:RNA polymerase-associated protein CTR9
MGNIFFANLRTVEKRYGKNLQYASDYYKRILEKDPLNAYAANGIGTVLAERGEIFKAKEIFNRVREVSGDFLSDALLNQGHIFLSQKKHSEAIKLYQSYMTRAEDVATPVTSKSRTDDVVDVLQFIAFAYFDWARHTELCNDSNAAPADGLYKEAMKHLQIAIDKNSKRDIVLRFNLCMTKLQAANCVLQKVTRNIPRTVEEVEDAHNGLEESYTIVEKILKDKEAGKEGGVKVSIKSSVLENFLKLCKENLASAKTHLQDDRQREEAARDERELRRQAAEMAQHEANLREALKKQEEAKTQHERDVRAESTMRKAEELSSGWRMDTEIEKSEKTPKGKKNKPPPPDDFIEEPSASGNLFESDSDDDEVASPKPKGRSASKMPSGELFGDGKKAAEEAKNMVQTLFDSASDDDDDDDDDNAGKKKAVTPAQKPGNSENPASAQDLFGESEEESSDEELLPTAGSKRPADDDDDDEDGEEGPAKKTRSV